jgi:predicted nucleotide-binding protein (sugar kinase/HSP70/actin superfamily)
MQAPEPREVQNKPDFKKAKLPDPRAVSLRVTDNGKIVSLILDGNSYSFDPDTALGVAAAIRRSANKIKALQFANKKGKRK